MSPAKPVRAAPEYAVRVVWCCIRTSFGRGHCTAWAGSTVQPCPALPYSPMPCSALFYPSYPTSPCLISPWPVPLSPPPPSPSPCSSPPCRCVCTYRITYLVWAGSIVHRIPLSMPTLPCPTLTCPTLPHPAPLSPIAFLFCPGLPPCPHPPALTPLPSPLAGACARFYLFHPLEGLPRASAALQPSGHPCRLLTHGRGAQSVFG